MNGTGEQMSIFDQDTWCGKMCVAASQVPEKAEQERTSELSWKSWRGLSKKESQFLDLRRESGVPQGLSSVNGGQSHGESRMPNIGAYLNVEEGLLSLLTSTDTMHLALFLENTNPTEAPCEEIPSHLSSILEENPDPKYILSSKACLGILNRASRRGKTLPPMLEEALIQTVVGGTEYGQEGIADIIEILREMRCEIGEEALKEWVQRVFVLVQSEEVLLGEMCESCEDSEDTNEQVLVEGDCKESNREEDLCELWSNGEVGDTPQRREPNEQLSEQLDLLMQKLSHENAQEAVIVYCLRIACEGEEAVSEALSTVSDGQVIGADDRLGADQYNAVILGDTVSTLGVNCGMSHGRQCVLEPQTAYTLQDREGKAGGGKGALIAKDLSATLRAGFAQTLFQPVYSVENHPNDSRVKIDEEGKVQALTGRMGTGGGNVPMVLALDRASFNQGKNAQYDFEVTDKGINSPIVAKGPGAVCYSVDQGGGKSSVDVREGKAPTLTTTHDGAPAICYPEVKEGVVGTLDAHYSNFPGMSWAGRGS